MSVLLKFKMDCSDEFDVYGFTIISNQTWEKYQEMFKCIDYPIEIGFGTNEILIFESIDDITESTTVIELSIPEERMLKKLFSHSHEDFDVEFGWLPYKNMVDELEDKYYKSIFGDDDE